MQGQYLHLIKQIGHTLEEAKIPYQFIGKAALVLQEVELDAYDRLEVSIQWDVFQEACTALNVNSAPLKTVERASVAFEVGSMHVTMSCQFNTTIKTDPYRISVEGVWCRSLYSYLYDKEVAKYEKKIHQSLTSRQQGFTQENEQAWNQNNYLALVNRYGEPTELAPKILHNPKWRLHPFYKYLESIEGKKITHLMGSNGVKAVAMAALGAEVKVVDFSKENAAFARELATAANVEIEYVVSDILSLTEEHFQSNQDFVLMELGVLHYLIDLKPLTDVLKRMLKPGGSFILHEFHPISTKLITSTGKKHKVTGNYFTPDIEKNEVAFTKHMPDSEKEKLSQVVQRKWTIGEVVTAVGQAGLHIKVLEEEPNHKVHDIGLPKTFTLVATL